jgi:hypothetical protein
MCSGRSAFPFFAPSAPYVASRPLSTVGRGAYPERLPADSADRLGAGGSGDAAVGAETGYNGTAWEPFRMARRRKYGFSFSWRRAVGWSGVKARLSRKIGVPLSRSGRQRKMGRHLGCCIPIAFLVAAAPTAYMFFI